MIIILGVPVFVVLLYIAVWHHMHIDKQEEKNMLMNDGKFKQHQSYHKISAFRKWHKSSGTGLGLVTNK
jgi:hypothetical protein